MAQAAALSGMIFDAADDEREPFAAYLGDDTSHAAAQAVATPRGWSATSVRKGGLPAALRLLGVAPPARFMVVDVEGLPVEEAESGLTELARLGASVIALGSVNDVNHFRRIMRTGARDYLLKPVDADALAEALVRLEQPGDGLSPQGRVVGMIGARGGVGVTTIAINAAFIMAEKLSRRTALVDMDIYAGNIALALDLDPTRGLREAFDDPERVDQVFLQNAMAKFGKSLHVLATEEAFDDTVRMTDDKVLILADTIRANFDMAVLDVPRHFVMREPALFTRFDDIVIVAELTLQSLRDTNRLAKLMAVRTRQAKIHVIANQVPARPDVTVKEFEAGMEGKLRCVFSDDARAMAKSALQGKALALADPRHRMITDLHRLCIELAGVPEETRVKSAGLFRRKARK
ncbi:pilus assembly protein CpaE [Amaricoccus macauensis]|uniref:Pilus assembly protein CpaE n=1 Tax=Amaricoccus macauensis TaxID=57001 RepID=A0A840SR18_9RHOB|nr:AAA family ATPase [Amaricoccus macauensis]MBB5223544.1 pilus assembly protein CpaE [Amaricoccus macauensis]